MRTCHAIVVDDDEDYRREVTGALAGTGLFTVTETSHSEDADVPGARADLIVIDNKYGDRGSYWQELIAPLRRRYPESTVLLVSQYDDAALAADVAALDESAKRLLGCDPYIQYLPKGTKHSPGSVTGSTPPWKNHITRIADFAKRLGTQLSDRAELQFRILRCALDGARAIRETGIHRLIEKVGMEGKADTKRMDVIAEHQIKKAFIDDLHYKDVVICTEEAGVHNELIHRISDPRFYIFSDPFDGSSAFEAFSKVLIEKGRGALTLQEVTSDPRLLTEWAKTYGASVLNAPMVSIVLAERHRVTGAVLVNLFTGDTYLSVDSGNYYSSIKDFASIPEGTEAAVHTNAQLDLIGGWTRVEFKKHTELVGAPLFLCSLGAVKRAKGERTWINKHAEVCVAAILPPQYAWKSSFDYRRAQGDFTPGPGRMIFLTNTPQARSYEANDLNGSSYHCVLSAGEPLTEWIGWFAFLRHANGISAYCLRQAGDLHGHCSHKHDHTKDPATLIPDELVSIFRDGYIDLGVLHTAYGKHMRRYHDTLLVVFDDDEAWKSALTTDRQGREECRYVRIPLFQVSPDGR